MFKITQSPSVKKKMSLVFLYVFSFFSKLKWKKIEKKIRQMAEVIPKHFGGLSTNPC